MIQTFLVRALLLPFSLLYGFIISIRNGLYSSGLLRSTSFSVPVIGIGNLSLGGAGKTPHVEYLISLLQPYVQVGVLSRGYKRKTKGFKLVTRQDTAETVGDEPFQYYLKHKGVPVAVSESRSIGIPMLLSKHPDIQVILLDDSFQHRSVRPGLHILLTEYINPYWNDFLLPAGRLREWPSAASRADIIVVTKCPSAVPAERRHQIVQKIDPGPGQRVFFSKYDYRRPYSLFTGRPVVLKDYDHFILLCAIASTDYLIDYLSTFDAGLTTMIYEDHHLYDSRDLSQIERHYQSLSSDKKIIITTEKDATRLMLHAPYLVKKNIEIAVLPVRVSFLFGEQEKFNEAVRQFLLNFTV